MGNEPYESSQESETTMVSANQEQDVNDINKSIEEKNQGGLGIKLNET